MLFNARTLDGLAAGQVDRTYRRWNVVRVRVGSRVTTRAGVVEVSAIEPVDGDRLTEEDAHRAGFDSLAALLSWTGGKGRGSDGPADLYEIGLRLVGPDPRVALRAEATPSAAALRDLDDRLDRMDAAAQSPWTRPALRLIQRRPGVVSTELAAEAGQERQAFKLRIRRLKALGLTDSLQAGYRLSPRGAAYLAHVDGPGQIRPVRHDAICSHVHKLLE
jgi:hypothetical protein